MIGPQLHMAVVAALKAASVASGAVYYHVAPGAALPYVEVAEEQVIDDGNQCADLFDVFLDIHVWTEATASGKIQAMQLGEAVRTALADPLSLADYAVILHEFDTARTMSDPNGRSFHGILTFRFLLQPV